VRAQEFLAEHGIEPKTEINAKKETHAESQAMALAATVSEIYSAKGKKVVHLNLNRDKPGHDEIKKVLLGPTGNLRAPTLRVGKTLLVGFNSETYEDVFGV